MTEFAFNLPGAKWTMLIAVFQAPDTYFNLQEIVSLTKVNKIAGYTFAGDLKALNLMTGVGSNARTHPCAYCISASKPWDSDVPLRTLDLNATQFDK